ncbi:hypothetical protein TWF506_006908 [Arthrobotrys conoides]|uniref:Ankyrin repeat protein n=1 Tax=Arthrobotrys conoides TaxID=74498 RepID=A0AAN8NA88_9PEZI
MQHICHPQPILLLLLVPCVSALDWEEFTNNFATDLAPLITLFGEQVSKQFLSESLSIWDNVIFAMAPLGLLTAVVSAIRVCGTPSMRAFIGRAQESPGTAEVELLSCTSETTAELFNEGGIARVFGEPRILEIMVKARDDSPGALTVGLFSDVRGPFWKEVGISSRALLLRLRGGFGHTDLEKRLKSRYHRPNLSLNVGITQLPKLVTYSAAVVGVVLQSGMLVFAALTVYTYPDKFLTAADKPAEPYAFPMTLAGTVLVCFGMFLCAFIIERSTDEVHYKQRDPDPKNKCKIYWVQPGGQNIGDQVFGSFIGYSEKLHYIRSTKADQGGGDVVVLWIAVITSVLGFILQFVGLRALHASVILFQVGATILMAIIRAMLRTQRLDSIQNVLGSYDSRNGGKHPFAQNPRLLHGHELDLLALHLFKADTMTISIDKGAQLEIVPRQRRKTSGVPNNNLEMNFDIGRGSPENVTQPLEAREQLTDVTSSVKGPSWDDLEVRIAAKQLAATIEGVMEVLAALKSSSISPGEILKWKVTVNTTAISSLSRPTILSHPPGEDRASAHQYTSEAFALSSLSTRRHAQGSCGGIPISDTFALFVEKGDGLSWKARLSQLEALIGLWALSITVYDIRDEKEDDIIPNHRIISTKDFVKTNIWYNVWVQRRLSGTCGPIRRDLIYKTHNFTVDKHLFGRLSQFPADESEPEVFAVKTQNSTITMCAQDIFMFFLSAALQDIDDIKGTTETRDQAGRHSIAMALQNSTVESLADRFETSGLGSREDAYMCIFPVLQHLNMMPSVGDVLNAVLTQCETYKRHGKWLDAEGLLQWLSNTSVVVEAHTALEALAELYYAAMRELDITVSNLGFSGISKMLKENKDLDILPKVREYAWIGLRIAEERGLDDQKKQLLASGARDDLVPGYSYTPEVSLNPIDWAKRNNLVMMKYLTGRKNINLTARDDLDGLSAIFWAVIHENTEMAMLLLQHNVETNISDKDGKMLLSYAAEHGLLGVLEILLKNNTLNINTPDNLTNMTPLMFAAKQGFVECVRLLLNEPYLAIDRRDRNGYTALHLATLEGHFETVQLLLSHGADISAEEPSRKLTALHMAANRGDERIVQYFLDKGLDTEQQDSTGRTPLDLASASGHVSVVIVLLKKGAQVFVIPWTPHDRQHGRTAVRPAANHGHLEVLKLLFEQKDNRSSTEKSEGWDDNRGICLYEGIIGRHEVVVEYIMDPIAEDRLEQIYARSTVAQVAIRTENLSMVQLVLKKRVSVDDTKKTWELHSALGKGNLDILRLIINSGADINARSEKGEAALHIATKRGDNHIVEYLLEHGAIVNVVALNGRTALHEAAIYNRFEVAQTLLGRGADIHALDTLGKTPLYCAAESGKVEVLKVLVEAGADGHAVIASGETALYAASSKGYESIVQILLQHGGRASVNRHETRSLRTPLIAAVDSVSSFDGIVKLLFDAGASPNPKDANGETAIFKATRKGHYDIIKPLLKAGADLGILDHAGKSVLFSAVEMGQHAIAKQLIDAGASVNARDNMGQTPLFLCLKGEEKFYKMAELLLKNGALVDGQDKLGRTVLELAIAGGLRDLEALLRRELEIQERNTSTS